MIKNQFDDLKKLAENNIKLLASWEAGDIRYDIVEISFHLPPGTPAIYSIRTTWECGYATFPKRPVKEMGYKGRVENVDVHGGITFAEPVNPKKPWNAYTYGFDTNHSGDVGKTFSIEFMKKQLEEMVKQLKKLGKKDHKK
jgi:hypothetical protein